VLLEPETPLRRCAELDFAFLPVVTPADMHTCYFKLKLGIIAAGLVAQYLSCKTLLRRFRNPEFRQKRSLEHSLSAPPHDSLGLQQF